MYKNILLLFVVLALLLSACNDVKITRGSNGCNNNACVNEPIQFSITVNNCPNGTQPYTVTYANGQTSTECR